MPRIQCIIGVSMLFIALPRSASSQIPGPEPVRVDAVAARIGVKPMPGAPTEIDPGRSATTTLVEPDKLERLGAKGLHEGARVTITCIGPARVRVEAEEFNPVEQRVVVTLRINDDGTVTKVDDRAAPKPPPPGE
jgi:hypothetical protein